MEATARQSEQHPTLRSLRGSESLFTERAALISSPGMFAWAATGGEWQMATHLKLLDEYLVSAVQGRIHRLMVFMPPRHGKSELVSRYATAWAVLQHHKRVILASYEARFAAWWGLQARELVRGYGQAFGAGAVTHPLGAELVGVEGAGEHAPP